MCKWGAYKWLSSVDVYMQVSVRKSLLFMPGNFLLMMLRIAAISSAATVRTTFRGINTMKSSIEYNRKQTACGFRGGVKGKMPLGSRWEHPTKEIRQPNICSAKSKIIHSSTWSGCSMLLTGASPRKWKATLIFYCGEERSESDISWKALVNPCREEIKTKGKIEPVLAVLVPPGSRKNFQVHSNPRYTPASSGNNN